MTEAFDIVAVVKASLGEPPIEIGAKGWCRYCGCKDRRRFRNKSHTFPEALGNKWIVSLDECDDCNKLFSRYDDALAKSIGAILTVGGTQGKGNSVRQTGRSTGPAVIRHSKPGEPRNLFMQVQGNVGDHVMLKPDGSGIAFSTPVAPERFIPRHAYKALAKMGLALLPPEELGNFAKLRAWVCKPDDTDEIPHLTVGLSFGSVGNAPALAAAALAKRALSQPVGPYMIFIMSIGSVCCQIDLKSDALDGGWPPPTHIRCGCKWTNVLAAPGRPEIRLDYGEPVELDWASRTHELSPIGSILTEVDLRTGHTRMTPVFRRA